MTKRIDVKRNNVMFHFLFRIYITSNVALFVAIAMLCFSFFHFSHIHNLPDDLVDRYNNSKSIELR